MNSIVDVDEILSENEHWKKLEEEWGIPIDLEVDTEDDQPTLRPVFSTLDLKTTFDSPFLFKKVRRNLGRQLSKKSTASALDYKEFLSSLQQDPTRTSQHFHYINGQIISAKSVDEICKNIDDIFRSIDKLSSCSTLRKPKNFPEVVQCSISASDLSFDDTQDSVYNSEIDRHMEEAFKDLSTTINSIENVDKSTLESVTTLVRKFSTILNHPTVQCSPRRRRHCSEKFKDLAEFWKSRAFEDKTFDSSSSK